MAHELAELPPAPRRRDGRRVSRRQAIVMSPAELTRYIAERRRVHCATIGPRGFPHVVPLAYVVRGEDIWAWTFAKSQKVRNLERDPRCALLIEDGDHYSELRGVMIEAETVIHTDRRTVAELGTQILSRVGTPGVADLVAAQVARRVGLQFRRQRTVSWDHRKLRGAY
jgi:hypothetical protein